MKAMELDHDMLWKAAQLMETGGGSFAHYIARAYFVADRHNAEALVTAFDDLFCKFYKEHRRNERLNETEDETQGEME